MLTDKEQDAPASARAGPGAAPGSRGAPLGDSRAPGPLRPALRPSSVGTRTHTARVRRPARLGPRPRGSAGPTPPGRGRARPRLRLPIPASPSQRTHSGRPSGLAGKMGALRVGSEHTACCFSPRGRPFGGRASGGRRRFGLCVLFRWPLAPLFAPPSVPSPTCRLARYPSGTRAGRSALALAPSGNGAARGGALRVDCLLMHPLANAPAPSLAPPPHRGRAWHLIGPAHGTNARPLPRAVFAGSVFKTKVGRTHATPDRARVEVIPLRHRPRRAHTVDGLPGSPPRTPPFGGGGPGEPEDRKRTRCRARYSSGTRARLRTPPFGGGGPREPEDRKRTRCRARYSSGTRARLPARRTPDPDPAAFERGQCCL